MPITTGDIRLVKSQVMTDADNGGGAATGVEVIDGQSNNVFPDTSELDHVVGRVQLRKVFIQINTTDTDTYLGANVIISKPPGNPEISGVLFSTADDFDTRDAAAVRIESYLAAGPSYPGYLFGDHIEGQMTVSIQQRTTVPLPSNGDTLVLVKFPNTSSEYRQFFRITDVSSINREFTTTDGVNFTRAIVSLTISQALTADFPGFDAVYADASVSYSGKTELLGSVVADAARYYGVVPLTAAASFGDFGVLGDGIYSQLVPSSRSEIPITDSRMNQQVTTLVATGVNVNQTYAFALDSTHPAFVGGGILPGTLSVTLDGVSTGVADKGGNLVDSIGTVVGAVDYANGELTLATDVLGTGATSKHVVYSRAAQSQMVSNSIGLDVTESNRRTTWVVTLDPIPAKGSMTASYLSQGHWYELTDDGSGALRGSDSSFGVGVLNFTTGTLSLTLGALPDAPSSIILQWAESVQSQAVQPTTRVTAGPVAMQTINTSVAIIPGALSISWAGGHVATDNGSGVLTGDASGTVSYTAGIVQIAPTVLPAPGTTMTVTVTPGNFQTHDVTAFTSSGSTWTFNVPPGGSGILPHSVNFSVNINWPARAYPGTDQNVETVKAFTDDGSGNLVYAGILSDGTSFSANVGTINYSTGNCVLQKTFTLHTVQPVFDTVYPLGTASAHTDGYIKIVDNTPRDVTATIENGSLGGGPALQSTYQFPGTGVTVATQAFDSPQITTQISDGVLAPGASWGYGGKQYLTLADGTVTTDISSATGVGTPAGTWVSSTGTITMTTWNTGSTSTLVSFSAQSSPTTSVANDTTQITDGVTFRTASAPIAPNGFEIIGTNIVSGDFNVTADVNGKISGGNVVGTIDYDTGVVRLRFGTPSTAALSDTVQDVSAYGVTGFDKILLQGVALDSLRYNAVAYSYLPLDPAILGLDPVRLPSDGRVPIFKKGGVAVVHYTKTLTAATHSNGDIINLGQVRVSAVEIVDSAGVPINGGYTSDMDAGTVTIVNTTGWAQPVVVSSRIEDMALITDAQISGQISLSRALSHAYPLGSYVSSAFLIGDMQAAVATMFEQQTWTFVWQDTPIGNPILAAYDQINHPPEVTNAAAETESWALIFTNSTNFTIVGEHLGTIGTGTTSSDCAPLNPNTGTPYFKLHQAGFGTGWAAGNVIRIDTVGALEPLWLARVVQQGDNVSTEDNFSLLIRGDVNT